MTYCLQCCNLTPENDARIGGAYTGSSIRHKHGKAQVSHSSVIMYNSSDALQQSVWLHKRGCFARLCIVGGLILSAPMLTDTVRACADNCAQCAISSYFYCDRHPPPLLAQFARCVV